MPALRPASQPDAAVSEVIGQILIFGILSMVLITSLLAFNVAKEGADERIEVVEADAVAQRLAGVVVDMALFAERSQAESATLSRALELPAGLQGDEYDVGLKAAATSADPDVVEVLIRGTVRATANLFSSGAPGDVVLCTGTVNGGGVRVVATQETNCAGVPVMGSIFYIFLEAS